MFFSIIFWWILTPTRFLRHTRRDAAKARLLACTTVSTDVVVLFPRMLGNAALRCAANRGYTLEREPTWLSVVRAPFDGEAGKFILNEFKYISIYTIYRYRYRYKIARPFVVYGRQRSWRLTSISEPATRQYRATTNHKSQGVRKSFAVVLQYWLGKNMRFCLHAGWLCRQFI